MAAGLITGVEPGSIGEKLGIVPGEQLLELNGHPVSDVIDYRFHSAEAWLEIKLASPTGRTRHLSVAKHPDQPLGLEFSTATFDAVRTCANCCSFCFVNALPPGVRKSLTVKDDDYRLSFLHGNFITLTNLTPADWERIRRMRLSPLYVSVHATNPPIRQKLLGHARAGRIMADLERLSGYGIEVHAQVVICPGVNDGPELDRTLGDLSELWPAVRSVGVVPVGTTSYRREPFAPVTPEVAREVLAGVHEFQQRCREQFEDGFVYAADEFYLMTGQPFPSLAEYGDFPQLENGIGMAVLFWDELAHESAMAPSRIRRPVELALVTGVLALPLLEDAARALNRVRGVRARVIAVSNSFFGPQVTVAGLLAGKDLRVALGSCRAGEVAVVPSHILRDGVFLDDVSLEEVERSSPVPVKVCDPHPAALFRLALEGGAGK